MNATAKIEITLTPELLGRAAAALYGRWWQTSVAAWLKVTPRTIRRWLAGAPMPKPLGRELLKACVKRQAELAEVIAELQKAERARLDSGAPQG